MLFNILVQFQRPNIIFLIEYFSTQLYVSNILQISVPTKIRFSINNYPFFYAFVPIDGKIKKNGLRDAYYVEMQFRLNNRLASIIDINFWHDFVVKSENWLFYIRSDDPFCPPAHPLFVPFFVSITGQQWRQWQIYCTLTRTAHGANTWHTQSIDPPTSAHLSTITVAECRARSSSYCCRRRRRWRRGPMTTEARVPPAGSSTCIHF